MKVEIEENPGWAVPTLIRVINVLKCLQRVQGKKSCGKEALTQNRSYGNKMKEPEMFK